MLIGALIACQLEIYKECKWDYKQIGKRTFLGVKFVGKRTFFKNKCCILLNEKRGKRMVFLFPLSFILLSFFPLFLFYLAHTWYSPGLSFEGSFFAFASKMLVIPSIDGVSPVYFTF